MEIPQNLSCLDGEKAKAKPIIDYLDKHGCPWTPEAAAAVLESFKADYLEYIKRPT